MQLLESAFSGPGMMTWLLIAVPLASAAFLLLVGKASDGWGHLLGTAAPVVSFLLGLVLFVQMLGANSFDPGFGDGRAINVEVYEWMATGSWSVKFGLLADPLSILFVLLITGVGSLIHVYSIGYMSHDDRRRRFFAYLNLFVAAMLTLVLADNYLVLFLGWEGVGLASYLLISFWAHKPSAARAGNKAFIVNRVGDLGLMMAIFTMFAMFGSVSFADVNAGASAAPTNQPRQFEAVEDLMLIPGFDYGLYARVAPLVSADLRGSSRVNPAAAPAGVLAVLAQGNSGAVQQYLNQRNSGQPGGDTSGFNSAFVDTAGGQLYRLVVSVPLEAGKILRLTQDVALGGGASRTAPWRVLRTERQIAAAG